MRVLILASALVLFILQPLRAQEPTQDNQEAINAAEEWLRIIDSGDYELGWREVSAFVRDQSTVDRWTAQLAEMLTSSGARETRIFLSAKRPSVVSSGLPAGEYVMVNYQSAYANVSPAAEVLVVHDEGERRWRVISYVVQPWPTGPNSRAPR
jgi:hypothetical protein